MTTEAALATLLARAGFIAAAEEAAELMAAAAGDESRLAAMVERRMTGEPLAWITGTVHFGGLVLRVEPGVYVPRWHTELVAAHAATLLPPSGTAIDVCTGCGAVAALLAAAQPGAQVWATDTDERAVRCASGNGVRALVGDLLGPLPDDLRGAVDLVTGVVPYVPTEELPLLQRDTFTFETPLAYDGGVDGTAVLRRVLRDARPYLRRGGHVVLELGGDQPRLLADDLDRCGYTVETVLRDQDSDVRGLSLVC